MRDEISEPPENPLPFLLYTTVLYISNNSCRMLFPVLNKIEDRTRQSNGNYGALTLQLDSKN